MKRILMYRWNAYNYLDVKVNFERMGYEVEEVWQKLESYDVDAAFSEKLSSMLDEKAYEFVFTVNYFAVISEVCREKGVLYVSWTCDNPLISMYHKSVFNDVNVIFTFDETNYREFKEMGVENIYHLPLAVDSRRITTILSQAEHKDLYKNEISFVGSLYERNSYDRMEKKLNDYLRGYFDALMNVQADLYGSSVVEDSLTPEILSQVEEIFELKKSEDSFSDLGLIFSTTVLGFKIAQIERKRGLLELAKKLPVSIYSNSDTSDLLNVTYKGGVDYWTELPVVFHESKINLNFTIPNIKSGIPLRVWDVLGSGGFLLTNFQAETPMYFKEGQDLVSFYSREDMLEKAAYYMEHEDERRRIATHGRETVEKHHDYGTRMKQMMEVLRNYMGK